MYTVTARRGRTDIAIASDRRSTCTLPQWVDAFKGWGRPITFRRAKVWLNNKQKSVILRVWYVFCEKSPIFCTHSYICTYGTYRLWLSVNEFQRQYDLFLAQRESMDMRYVWGWFGLQLFLKLISVFTPIYIYIYIWMAHFTDTLTHRSKSPD